MVDYGSNDGLSDWVWENFNDEIAKEKIVFFEVKNEVRWNTARAKNLAHRLASCDYLFNLDADNYLTRDDINLLEKAVAQGLYCHQWSGHFGDGSCGRIGLPRELFEKLGGYDESFLPVGGEDIDLLRRLAVIQSRYAKLGPPKVTAVQNSFEERTVEAGTSKDLDPHQYWNRLNSMNLRISKLRLETEGPVRFGGGFSYHGLLNGKGIIISGLNDIHAL